VPAIPVAAVIAPEPLTAPARDVAPAADVARARDAAPAPEVSREPDAARVPAVAVAAEVTSVAPTPVTVIAPAAPEPAQLTAPARDVARPPDPAPDVARARDAAPAPEVSREPDAARVPAVAVAAEVTSVTPTPVTVIAPAAQEPAQLASTPSRAAAAVVEPAPAMPQDRAAVSRDEPVVGARSPTTVAEPAPELRMPPEPAAPAAVSGLSMERLTNLDDLLRLAASCGASTLYLAPNARPSVRVGGELWVLEDIPILEPAELDALLFAQKLAHDADASAFAGAEWTFDLPGAGRIRCMTFSDQRGPGSVFRIVPVRTVVADQLGLSLETQALTLEKDGLILVTGPRSSGKNAVIGGLLDLINRTRQAYIVTVQREVNATWEGERAFISQREARGGLDDMLAVGRAALRENPDVLVLQEVRSAALMSLAFDAAASGQLVIAGYTARTAPAAIAGVLSLYPVEQRRSVQVSLSQSLRGVVAQMLVPRAGGGRAAARELLLNTPPIAAAVAEGKTWQLPLAIEAGRNHGMVTMNEALVDLVQRGIVAAEDAYRQAPEQMVFLDALKRHGIDTSFLD
jgi:twitching motility protein PilT